MADRRATSEHEHRPATGWLPAVELVRSRARRRQASARVVEGRVVVRLPAGLAAAEESALVHDLVSRVLRRDAVERFGGDEALTERAHVLADRHLDGVRPTSVSFSHRMDQRWGSCTPSQGTIRIASQVAAFPAWVLDGVLVHELAHLVVAGHGPRFRQLVARHPDQARADAYLDGVRRGFADALVAGTPKVLGEA